MDVSLRPEEYKALYEIGRVIIQMEDAQAALQEILRLARPVFIFDNVVLYEGASEMLTPTYARSIGRGRSVEAEADWGETVALQALQRGEPIVESRVIPGERDSLLNERLARQDFLGLPLKNLEGVRRSLVFIRFGGPPFLPEQVRFAGLIAELVEQLLERQRLVERVAALEAERQLARLQGHFVAMISHELRSPLGFIKGYATTLLRQDTEWDPATRREFLTIIDEEADRLASMIDNLLDSSRLQAGTMSMDFQNVCLTRLLQDFLARYQAEDLPFVLHAEIPDEPLTIWGDPRRISQVLENLLSNATKYAPEGEVVVSLSWDEQFAHILVSDDGPGIPPEHRANIFKRFYRLPRHEGAIPGTGLGLFICHQIVQMHGGKMYVDAAESGGAAFHVLLPRDTAPGQEAKRA